MTKKICKHEWEDAPYPEGITMFFGGFNDMGEEKRVVCKKCGELDFIRIRDMGSLAINIDDGVLIDE